MGIINVLDTHVANMIAAGEVVENPASVVKELLENAIDAGASAVTCEIQNGGISYIRVTDDGKGMEREDAKCAFLRHATSKISKADDLEKIGTLGFRGEALAAISAVSKIDLITKTPAAELGSALRVEAGKVIRESDSGCPSGTTIIVRELFYNTPARMRFLKKDATEAANVEGVVKSAALSHPEVSIKLIKDGRDILHTPGDGVVKSCIYALFGRDFANNMAEVKTSDRGLSVSGFTCLPSASRGNRAQQFFFVNGRPVKSRMMSAALDAAYKEKLMKGRFPTCVLMLTLPLSEVDVNVHPAKTEVKFSKEREVFDIVYYGVKSALEKKEERVITPPRMPKAAPVDNITENQTRISFSAPPKREEAPVYTPPRRESLFSAPVMMRSDSFTKYDREIKEEKPKAELSEEKKEEIIPPPEEKELQIRFIGEAMNTYIIVECEDKVVFIDKHAAHERIIFEKLKATVGSPQSQLLLSPEIIELDKALAAALLENEGELSKLGFEIGEFGDGSVAINAVPDGIDAHDAVAVLEDMAELISGGARAKKPDVLSETMYSVACKAAIKAGQKNSPEELLAIAKRVLASDDIRYCPHGRPVMIEYTRGELERKFKRIV